jgi:hypothetical protein
MQDIVGFRLINALWELSKDFSARHKRASNWLSRSTENPGVHFCAYIVRASRLSCASDGRLGNGLDA